MDRKKALAASWNKNAANWSRVVRDGLIASRRAGTDAAILKAIAGRNPSRFLDAGCGEGWHVRRVADVTGCDAVGFDGSAALIADARATDPVNRYDVLTYDAFVSKPNTVGGPFDVIAFNYALFDEDIVPLLSAAKALLSQNGAVVIQTLHPWVVSHDDGYRDGWRTEDFAALGDDGWTPMPWYFRTMASWHAALRRSGLTILDLAEPAAESGGKPLSLLLTCEPVRHLSN
jgi:SAM-dependent methyltransferase